MMQSNAQNTGRASIEGEIVALRVIIEIVRQTVEAGEGDIIKMGALLARLSDSVGRALLVHQKLDAGAAQDDHDFDDMLRHWKDSDSDE